jgi:hypothetical protein
MALKSNPALTKAIQRRVARIAVSPSSVRGSPAGSTDTARNFFSRLSLRRLADADGQPFAAQLDELTDRLAKNFRAQSRRGVLLESSLIFFSAIAHITSTFVSEFGLGRLERQLELPLDSITARKLRCTVGQSELSGWPSLIGLTEL